MSRGSARSLCRTRAWQNLALVIHEAGNTNTLFLATVDGDPAQKGKLTTLASFSPTTPPGRDQREALVSPQSAQSASATVTGKVFRHSAPADPNSALSAQVGTTLTYRPNPAVLPPAMWRAPAKTVFWVLSINAVLNVSVTNFSNNAAQLVHEAHSSRQVVTRSSFVSLTFRGVWTRPSGLGTLGLLGRCRSW